MKPVRFSARCALAAGVFAIIGQPPASGAGDPFPVFHSFPEMAAADAPVPEARAVTNGPKAHWFGYYDKFQLDPSGRYLLCMEIDFEHHLPEPAEAVTIGMVDLDDGNRWVPLGRSRAWSWQQGCMLQWLPGSQTRIIWNDRDGDRYISRVLDVKTGLSRTLPRPVGHISPDGKWALCEDYRRIWDIRAGYGYPGIPDACANDPTPSEIGVWLMDLATGESKLAVSVADLARIPYPGQSPDDKHYINHLSWNTDGTRFLMFNRWVGPGQPTRVFTMNANAEELRLLSARKGSHWTWRDPEHVVIWGENDAYNVYKDDNSGELKRELWKAPNGHQGFIPNTDNAWMVTDTYPQGPKDDRPGGDQILYLHHLPTGRFVLLGRFRSPDEYRGDWRCDLHPRVSRDGTQIIIDSPHAGNGRQQYMIDISAIVGGAG